MRARIVSPRPLGLTLAAAALAMGVTACGQSDSTEQSAGGDAGATAGTDAGVTAPTPGPDATAGCDELIGPVFELIDLSTSGGDTAAASEDVARVASGVDDNALSAVASRLSGLAVQPEVDDDAVLAQWGQFRQLCDID